MRQGDRLYAQKKSKSYYRKIVLRLPDFDHAKVAREFGLSRDTVRKMLQYAVPPSYQRQQPIKKPKLGPLLGVIDIIREEDKQRPIKQRHTAKRIFDRLRVEHAFPGDYTLIEDYVGNRSCTARKFLSR